MRRTADQVMFALLYSANVVMIFAHSLFGLGSVFTGVYLASLTAFLILVGWWFWRGTNIVDYLVAVLAALFAIGAAPVLLLVWLVPLPLVLPALSIASFIIACAVALFAHCSGVDRTAPGMKAWDIVALFTSVWIGAGMIGGPKQMIELFEQLATAP